MVALLGGHPEHPLPLDRHDLERGPVRDAVLLPAGHARPQGAHLPAWDGQGPVGPTCQRARPVHHEEWRALVARGRAAAARGVPCVVVG
ncbi:MAG: hypothetical protein CL844_05645 [Crocinitomicaceae bacterium]|nr:hypothetical protein [Crocinitomicaceae bacterium]